MKFREKKMQFVLAGGRSRQTKPYFEGTLISELGHARLSSEHNKCSSTILS